MESLSPMVLPVSICLLMHVDRDQMDQFQTRIITTVNLEVLIIQYNIIRNTVYAADLLWDGKGCNTGNSCCSQAGMPWFYKDVLGKINEPIEARICRDQTYTDEGILIKDLELYIQ